MDHSALLFVRTKLLVTGAAAALLLAGCGGSDQVCETRDESYATARNNEPLRVPQGMSTPNRSEALSIPDVNAPTNASERTSCLDEPPSYFRSAGTVARSPEEVIASWAQAWANREADAVVALYSTAFQAADGRRRQRAWLEQRREQVATGPTPDAMVEGLTVEPDGARSAHREVRAEVRRELSAQGADAGSRKRLVAHR